MKILHITTHLNRGGITSYLASLAIGLKKRGHSVTVASSGGDSQELFLKNNIGHLSIPIRTKKEISPSVLFSYFILSKFLKDNPVDIIHAHTRVTQVLAWSLAGRFKIPLVTTCHGFFKPRWHRKKFACWGNKVIAISRPVKEHLIRDLKVSEENISLIHNGVDLAKFREHTLEEINYFKKEIGIPDGSFVVGTAARFSTVKGLEYFIKALPAVLKENKQVIFLLLGYGEEEYRLRQIAKDLQVDNRVIFFRPTKDTYEYLCVLDVFVMPSIQEGLGLSILEAQAQRIPVIASDVGGIPDIIDNSLTGILVEPKDESALSNAIIELIKDNNLYSNIKNNAYDRIVKDFTVEQMVAKTEAVYKELLCRLE
ncbi:MAG: glycosyltransferase family 4 protein [Candidatus Omnitrophica bacterium]|nr:glycosyltransferase family 4 protein [Candidatus Omnitrophota bacterium]MDD5351834.1 glycosyltransferase family 4 protein [Candidatus Omnitrophota bacterium]MDD5550660.1 glycosyltransferase family 4 protein [Candidatus Omnitrophota bacterium]